VSKRDTIQTQEGHHLDINICCLAQRALLHRPQAFLWPVLSDHPCQSSSQDNKKSVDGYSPSFGGVPKTLMHNLQFAQYAVTFAGCRQDRKTQADILWCQQDHVAFVGCPEAAVSP